MKYIRPLKKESTAVVSVVLALLLLGLLAITLTTIQTVYVPRWVEQQEGVHMHEVAAQFADLKHAIDIQSIAQDKTPISTPITLGTEQQSFLTTSRAYGSIHIDSDSFSISLSNSTNQISVTLGSLYYASRNSYYVDQSFILEAAAVIISQSEGQLMSTDPPIVFNDQGFDMICTFFDILERGGKTDFGGYGTYLIQTNFSNINSLNMFNTTTIQISTYFTSCWEAFFNTSLSQLGFIFNSDYSISSSSSQVDISISQDAQLDIKLNIPKIFAQISPGRVG